MSEAKDYRDTVFLPKTDFPMKAGLPQKEPAILARWREMGLHERLRERRRGREKFIFHDGPPYANGDMHIGHALNHILKDMVVRTQTLLGKDAPYVPGWDCHGLPIEWKVEEQYRKKKLDKDQVDPVEFRAECRAYAQHWVDTQREQLKRLGVNADWDNPYLTMDFEAEATIVSELMKFAESGQLYRGAKPVMWSPVEKTALAEAEIEYEDIVSTQIDVAFEIVESPILELVGAHAVIWTTTPWTIPVNQAIAYGPDVRYGLYEIMPSGSAVAGSHEEVVRLQRESLATHPLADFEGALLLADDLAHATEQRLSAASGANRGVYLRRKCDIDATQLAGTIARHPIYNLLRRPGEGRDSASSGHDGVQGQHHPGLRRDDESEGWNEEQWERALAFFAKPRPFLPGDFVTTDSGTGLVHMAPDHGEDDFDLCKANGLEPVFAVEGDGKYRADWAWLGGQGSVINPKFNAPNGPICSDLRDAGALLAASADYKHSYPHSWRSKAKVIYRCTPQWFVPMDRALPGVSASLDAGVSTSLDMSEVGAEDQTIKPAHPERSRGTGSSEAENPQTLRQTALSEIARVRFVPEKGRNRIGSMVEGRPDWVLSRQRAWGVPITLFVDRKSGQYLVDPEVNARIIAAVRDQGVDAWSDERAQEYLGDAYRAEDYERVTDILDVWFDSGCTHAFVLESGRWPDQRWPADLYLEGSDQHRGWFQSSLLESCATRGRAPYDAVLTHGFTLDAKGLKMSKSLGNTVDPLKIMESNGADIIRLWALSVDFTEDHRIGDEILKGVADQYRKLRNTFRYLLGALDGFDEDERVDADEMPELERYILHLLAEMDAKLRQAVADYDFNAYVRALTDFCNDDLSAFFFDIRKDSLYCDAEDAPKRMAYRTVLDTLFHALVRWAAPVLVFTAEEVWQTRYPDAEESVHFLDWPEVDEDWLDAELGETWGQHRELRTLVTGEIEPLRRDKTIGSSLEAKVGLGIADDRDRPTLSGDELAELFIVSEVVVSHVAHGPVAAVQHTNFEKCGRCWRHLPEVEEEGALCRRCEAVVGE